MRLFNIPLKLRPIIREIKLALIRVLRFVFIL